MGESRKQEIIEVSRELFERQGFSRVTIRDIARHMKVSRGAIYYYFQDKDALVDAVIDDYIQDLKDMVHLWENSRPKGDSYVAVREFVLLIKQAVFDKSDLRKYLSRNETAEFHARFVGRTIRAVVEQLKVTTIEYYAKTYTIEIDYLYEMFYILFAGVSTYLRNHPDADLDTLTRITAQILRIDLEQKPPEDKLVVNAAE